MTRRGSRAVLVAAACVGLLSTACSGGSSPTLETPTSTGATTPSVSATPTSSIDPNAQPAVATYEAFVVASRAATEDPQAFASGKNEDFTRSSFDPIQGLFTAYVMGLAREQAAFRGTPPRPRIRVKSVELDAKPYPRVVLLDCQTPAPTWEKYLTKTGKSVPSANGKVPPPYELTVEVIYYEGRWGASTVSSDKSRTCTAE